MGKSQMAKVIQGDCLEKLNEAVFRREASKEPVCLTFLDPPFNQGKDYDYFDDALPERE